MEVILPLSWYIYFLLFYTTFHTQRDFLITQKIGRLKLTDDYSLQSSLKSELILLIVKHICGLSHLISEKNAKTFELLYSFYK